MNSSLFTECVETKLVDRRNAIGIVNHRESLGFIYLCISHLSTCFSKAICVHVDTHALISIRCNLMIFIESHRIRLRIGQTCIINASAQHKIFAYISAQKSSFKFCISLLAVFPLRPPSLAYIQFIFIFFVFFFLGFYYFSLIFSG